MYSNVITQRAIESALQKGIIPSPPIYHSRAEIELMVQHLDSLYDFEKDSWTRPLTPDEVKWIRHERFLCRVDFRYFLNYCWIKSAEDLPIRFFIWVSQLILLDIISENELEGISIELMILKARQLGISRLVSLLLIHRCLNYSNLNAALASSTPDKTGKLANMIEFTMDHLPHWLKSGLVADRHATKQTGGIWREWTTGTTLTLQHGAMLTGIARGETPTVNWLSEVSEYSNADEIDSSLFRAVHQSRRVMTILESTANGTEGWWHDTWQVSKEGWPARRSRLRPVFLPWFAGGLYPTPDFLRRSPIPLDYRPAAFVLEHARRAQEYVQSDLLLSKHLGKGWKMPVEQQWFYEVERSEAERKDRLSLFLQEMCLVGSTRISTELGIIRMDEAVEAVQCESGRILKYLQRGTKPTFIVETEDGRQIRGTSDHLVKVLPDSWKEIGELKAGDKLKLLPPMFAEQEDVVEWDWLPSTKAFVQITPQVGRFLGYFMGDGSCDGNSVDISVDSKDTDVVSDVEETLDYMVGTHRPPKRIGQMYRIYSTFTKWPELLWALGCLQERTPRGHKRFVRVPECIFRSPRIVVREFISALFECDGHAYKDAARANMFSKHLEFVRDVQLLLLGFGIRARISPNQTKKMNGKVYEGRTLSISAAYVNTFYEEIGFISSRKHNSGMRRTVTDRRGGIIEGMEDRVKSVIPTGLSEEVFDISVESTHKFSANGLEVHNCASDVEAFQNTDRSVFGPEVITHYRDRVRIPLGVYGLLGPDHIMPYRIQPHVSMIDPNLPRVPVKYSWGQTPVAFELVPLRWQGYSTDSGQDKIYIWEWPERGEIYALGVDTAEGVGKDNSVIEGLRKGSSWRPAAQVCEFASGKLNAIDLVPYVQALAALYSVSDYSKNPEVDDASSTFLRQCRLAIECKGMGDQTQNKLHLNGWSNFHPWLRTDKREIDQSNYRTIGIFTTEWFREIIIAHMNQMLRDNEIDIRSPFFVREMEKLVDNGIRIEGHPDDRFFGLGFATISLYQFERERPVATAPPPRPDGALERKYATYPKSAQELVGGQDAIFSEERRLY